MMQIVRQTWQERYDMYMRDSKENLATMLAERDKYYFPDGCKEFEKEIKSMEIKTYSDKDFKDKCHMCVWRMLNKEDKDMCFKENEPDECNDFKSIFSFREEKEKNNNNKVDNEK